MNTTNPSTTSSFNTSSANISTTQPGSTSELLSECSTAGFSNKTIIITLSIIIFLVLLNDKVDNILRNIFVIIYNFCIQVLGVFGFVTGSTINLTANVAGNVARTGIDLTEGTLHSVGNILTGHPPVNISGNTLGASTGIPATPADQHPPGDLAHSINTSKLPQQNNIPSPDTSENPIQNPIAQSKSSWCLVGEYKGRRGCIDVSQYDKCMSGQVYPSQKMCLNPAIEQPIK